MSNNKVAAEVVSYIFIFHPTVLYNRIVFRHLRLRDNEGYDAMHYVTERKDQSLTKYHRVRLRTKKKRVV